MARRLCGRPGTAAVQGGADVRVAGDGGCTGGLRGLGAVRVQKESVRAEGGSFGPDAS